MSVQGNIKPLRSLTEPLQIAKDNGAKRALIPIENKRSFLDVSADIMKEALGGVGARAEGPFWA
jgi:ATP-dependent Lon protease